LEPYLAASPTSCVLRGIVDAVLETIELVLGAVLVFFPVFLDFMALVHEQCTTSKSSGSTHGSVCYIVVLLLLRLLLLLFVAAVLALLVVVASVAAAVATRVLESAFTVLLVDKQPAVLAIVPDSAPWRWDLWGALARAVALLLLAAILRTALIVVVAALVVAALVVAALVLLTAATTLALAAGEFTDQITE
jgi:hypothetical protein